MSQPLSPFDQNNPFYVAVAKQTRSTRRTVQRTTLLITGLTIVTFISRSGVADGWFGGLRGNRVNQFGVIRRK
jgi:hypothetical protein